MYRWVVVLSGTFLSLLLGGQAITVGCVFMYVVGQQIVSSGWLYFAMGGQ